MEFSIDFSIVLCLPTPLNHVGPRIILKRIGAYDPGKYKVEEIFQMSSALQDITLLEDDCAMVHGVVGILDASQISLAHMTQMTPALMKRVSVYSEDAVPMRMRATHIINATSAFERVFNMVKPLMSAKKQQRVKLGQCLDLINQIKVFTEPFLFFCFILFHV